MAAGFDVERLKGLLECSICLERYNNPKMLTCAHHCCKECLEDIIKFHRDGSAIITCPMRCPDQTIIANNKTVNDLLVTYDFKNMLEALEVEDQRLNSQIPICCYDENCKNEISVHCCEMIMCRSCHVNHERSESHYHQQKKVNLIFSKKEDKLKILCEEHVSKCTHLCIDNKFLCIYCLHRDKDHKQHSKNTVEAEVASIKQILLHNSEKKKNFGSIDQFLSITEQNMITDKEKFEELLQQRKEKCLILYNDFLNKEQELLKNRFQSICSRHLKQYPLDITPKYYKEKLQKRDAELAIEKEAILHTVSKSENLCLNFETVSVSEDIDFRSDHPLGEIEVIVGEKVSINNEPMPTLKYKVDGKKREQKQKQECEKEMLNILWIQNSKLVDDYEKKLNVLMEENTMLLKSQIHYEQKLNILTEENTMLKQEIEATRRSRSHHERKSNMLRTQIEDKSKSERKVIKSPSRSPSRSPSSKNVRVFFDIVVGKVQAGRIVMDMFHDITPRTCQNFIQLCTHQKGFGYRNSKFFKIKSSGGYCIGGDITGVDRSSEMSVCGNGFRCENFIHKHDGNGNMSMLSSGGYVNYQFRICTKATAKWDGVHVVFGKVTSETYPVLEKIIAVCGGYSHKDVVIVNCGVLSNGLSNG